MTEPQIKTMIFSSRRDLQKEFPIGDPAGQQEFEAWWSDTGRKQYGLHDQTAPHKNPEPAQTRVTLVGYNRGELGLGDHIRTAARTLESAGCSCNIINFNHNLSQRQLDDTTAHFESDELADIVLVCLSFDQLPYLFQQFSPESLASRYIIAFSAWELNQLPVEMLPPLQMLDEIWTISHFMKQAVAPLSPVPVLAMPIAVDLPEFDPGTRKSFALSSNEIIFLTVFDAGSFLARKNPIGVIHAFQQAFQHQPDRPVRLILKTHSAWQGLSGWDELHRLASDPRITLIHENWDKTKLHQLMANVDCFVSLHRAEGFGRSPAEAMLLGKPVILTGYSGVREYAGADNCLLVDYKLVPVENGEYIHHERQAWAEPDIAQAADHMRRVADGGPHIQNIAARGRDTIRESLNLKSLGTRYAERIQYIHKSRTPALPTQNHPTP